MGPRPGSRGHSPAASPTVTCRETCWPHPGSHATAGLRLAWGPCGSGGTGVAGSPGSVGVRGLGLCSGTGHSTPSSPFPCRGTPDTHIVPPDGPCKQEGCLGGRTRQWWPAGLAQPAGEVWRPPGCTMPGSLPVPWARGARSHGLTCRRVSCLGRSWGRRALRWAPDRRSRKPTPISGRTPLHAGSSLGLTVARLVERSRSARASMTCRHVAGEAVSPGLVGSLES